ncbi:MAG: bifunctional riboflavin kinase/FAD synthetase [Bacteroidales bacterium]|nr:bifunctional riboflavin kinase/FAD synthetase [Bacteroidales bacterium]
MEVLMDIDKISISETTICVGTFDGLHKGHMKVINRTIEKAKELGTKSLIFTFWLHPQEIIFPKKKIEYLNVLEEKIERFTSTGIDYLVVYPFNKTFAQLSSKEFIKSWLLDRLNMRFLIIGHDHQFGKKREGSYENVLNCAKTFNFGVEQIEQHTIGSEIVSSTNIRHLIKEGRIDLANQLLGYDYFITGTVVRGKSIGHKIGFPTANVATHSQKILPKDGVYCVEVFYKDEFYQGMGNFGFNPTIDNSPNFKIEIHLFNFEHNIYDQQISISLKHRLRSEKKFNSIEALKTQLEQDRVQAIQYFNTNAIKA